MSSTRRSIRRIRIHLATCVALTAGITLPAVSHAEFPERPITMVVPYAPGGAADALARVLAQSMGTALKTSIIVENRAGASGTIGAGYVAKAPADGYTMLYDATPYSINPHLYKQLPYAPDALKPLSLVSLAPNILIVKTDSPYKDLQGLIASAKAAPGKLNFASGGSGTVQRLASELFRQQLQLDMVHVPYKSGGPAITDVMAGQVDFMFSTVAASSPLVEAGKLRALAISAPQRIAKMPDVPTVAETAVPGFEVYEWNGVFVPAGVPPFVATKLHDALVAALQHDDVQKRFTDVGAKPIGSTPAEFSDYLKKEDAKWADVVKRGNISTD